MSNLNQTYVHEIIKAGQCAFSEGKWSFSQ